MDPPKALTQPFVGRFSEMGSALHKNAARGFLICAAAGAICSCFGWYDTASTETMSSQRLKKCIWMMYFVSVIMQVTQLPIDNNPDMLPLLHSANTIQDESLKLLNISPCD